MNVNQISNLLGNYNPNVNAESDNIYQGFSTLAQALNNKSKRKKEQEEKLRLEQRADAQRAADEYFKWKFANQQRQQQIEDRDIAAANRMKELEKQQEFALEQQKLTDMKNKETIGRQLDVLFNRYQDPLFANSATQSDVMKLEEAITQAQAINDETRVKELSITLNDIKRRALVNQKKAEELARKNQARSDWNFYKGVQEQNKKNTAEQKAEEQKKAATDAGF